jgi:hypothetical protein
LCTLSLKYISPLEEDLYRRGRGEGEERERHLAKAQAAGAV